MTGAPPIDLDAEHFTIGRDILREYLPDLEVWAFGSRVNGKAKRYSDLDLAVITDAPIGLGPSAALSQAFSESDLPFKVYSLDWSTTAGAFRAIIRKDKGFVQTGSRSALPPASA